MADDDDSGWDNGFDVGYVAAVAEIMSGERNVPEWAGSPLDAKYAVCEACTEAFPDSEYGLSIKDELWATIAPRPDADYFGSGVLCLDCIEKRLGREVNQRDVMTFVEYGERPTTRAAMFALVCFGAIPEADRLAADETPTLADDLPDSEGR